MKSNKKLYEKIINRIRAFEVCFSFIVQLFSQQERQKNIPNTYIIHVVRNQEQVGR